MSPKPPGQMLIILRRELREVWRYKSSRVLVALLLLLVAVAALDGWNRAEQAQRARQAAEQSDRRNWVNQGHNNPHGAAHFARYAFRPTPALAAFEPGVFDFAGAAVWMEAHHQNPATLRRAEDSLGRAPLSGFSVAWVTRSLGSLVLVVLLFRSMAQERERKTLRSIAAAGVFGQAFVLGKICAAGLITFALTLSAMSFALVVGLITGLGPSSLLRAGVIVLVTLASLCAFAFVVLAISAHSRSCGVAMIRSAALWLVWAVGIPVLAAQLATALYPDLHEHTFKATLQEEAQTAFWQGGEKEPAVQALTDRILQERGKKSLEELNFNPKGVMLQAHENFANRVFDLRFGELYDQHQSQDRVISWLSLTSPLLALARVGAGLAGTDLLAQQRFSQQAEAHRRQLIARLNQDFMENAGDQGMKYQANRSLWETIADFHGQSPTFGQVLRHYAREWCSIGLWLLLGAGFAFRSGRLAMQREIRA